MGTPWYILALPILVQSVMGVTLDRGPSELIQNLTSNGNQYTLYMNEDNHVEGSDNLLLFYFNDVTSTPACSFMTPDTFQYNISEIAGTQYGFNTTQYFDYETQANKYSLKCDFDSDFVLINVNIINIDDEPPTLTAPMCSMDENSDYTEENTNCTCILSDPDGWLSKTTFTVINSNPKAVQDWEKEDELFKFDIDRTVADNVYNTTVFITTLKQLDYEKKIFYSFSVQAKDSANHPTTPKENVTCIIDVVDQNDMPPQWTDYFTTQEITEEEANIFIVTAVDGDKGINAEIEYSLISHDEKENCGADACVSITTENGKGIIAVKPIDRDAQDLTTYKFEVMAQEKDDPPYTANITITFFIDDIDDNNPLVMSLTTTNSTEIIYTDDDDPKIAEFTFYENFASTIDGEIAIQDIDTGVNAQFNVVLIEDASENSDVKYTDAFLVVPTAGYRTGDFQISVKDSSYLDFENLTWQNFQFYVHSYGSENATKEDHLLVKIHLLDYNDEWPIFEESAYSVSVKETIKKGETIIQVKATDRDAEDKILNHQIIAADAIFKSLAIDSAEGVITVAIDNAFDYDRLNPIIFQVEATDHAEHVTIVPVTVNLLDVNNKAPTYQVADVIRVDENQIIGIPLNANITASDVDTTRDLTAEIDWDKSYATKNSQRLNNSDPVIQKAMQFLELSFEKTSEDTISITLKVSDINANETAPDYETFDTFYLDIRITDKNTEVPEFADKMSIDALIVININDINDNAPIFTPETLAINRTVYEMSKAETIVGTIEATDADIGDTVTYSCTYVDKSYDWFTCSSTGVLTVTNSDEIDCDTDELYYVQISCKATDGFWNTSQEFSIFIRDKNNKYPQIQVNDSNPSASVVEVYEKSDQDAFVTNVGYTDQDRDIPFKTSICSFQDSETECYQQFIVKANVVVVKNAGKQLNRDEGTDEYNCTVYCTDNPKNDEGEPQLTSNIPFKIKLLDINDHCPELQTFTITTNETAEEVSEKLNSESVRKFFKDDLIGDVIAQDIDEGINAEIVINILTVTRDENNTDYTDEQLFDMVKEDDYIVSDKLKKWHLTAKKDLRGFYGEYTLQLELRDLGTPPKSTEDNDTLRENSKLKVTVSKYNYYPPKFIFPNDNITLVLSSAQTAGKQLVMYYDTEMLPDINITTGEDDKCIDKWDPTFDVALNGSSSEKANFFVVKKLNNCIAQLQVDDTYKKSQSTYEVQLTAKLSDDAPSDDDGEAAYSESIKLNIIFADPGGDPIFNTTLGAWNFSLPEANETAMEELPEERKAYYPNVHSNITVFYSLHTDDSDIVSTFDVESNSGNIQVLRELDYLEKPNYEFKILAATNQSIVKNPDSLSLMNVTIVVEDVNNHVPQWTQDTFFGAIMKSSQKGVTILTAAATDLDVIDQGQLKYTLNSTIDRDGSQSIFNIEVPFLLDEATGDVKLNFAVEANMDGHFIFKISVEDAEDRFHNGPHYNQTTATIYIVTEDNTVTFKFENTLDVVVANKQEITKAISDALGWDCHDYSIDRDSQNGVVLDNVTACNIYCVDNNTLLASTDIKSKLNNINTFKAVKQALLQFSILLLNFESDSTTPENLEATLKAALIGVSVVLGALCIILAVTFFLKARELNRRLKHLTEQKFGSDESNINRKGVNAPTTNHFAEAGSNPIFSNEIKRDDFMNYDKKSITSGDSDLIGVEDSPEFDGVFTVQGANPRFSSQ